MKESFESAGKENHIFQAAFERRRRGAARSKSDQTITFFLFLFLFFGIVIRPYFLTATKIIAKVMR